MRVPALVTLLVVQCGLTFRVDPEAEPIYILSCVKNLAQFNHRMAHLARMFDSVIRTAQRRPLHWIMPALPADVPMIDFLLQRIIQEHARVPVQVEYLDMSAISEKFAQHINVSRNFFLNTKPLQASVYWDEVFHISHIYHRMFPFRKLIALDIDMKFMVDIADLADQFNQMTERNLIAIGFDLTPHYWYDFRHYRDKNPESPVGHAKPGLQGFNTGVTLMNLEALRANSLYNSYVDNTSKLAELIAKYEFQGTLAHQDFFTLLGMEHEDLFYILDCSWNRQLDTSGLADEKFNKIFEDFHMCPEPIKIFHANGGSIMAEDVSD